MSRSDYRQIADEERPKVAAALVDAGFSEVEGSPTAPFTKDGVALIVQVKASWVGWDATPRGVSVAVRSDRYIPSLKTRTYRYGKNGFNYASIVRGANEMVEAAKPKIAELDADRSERDRLREVIEPYDGLFALRESRIVLNRPVPEDRLDAVRNALEGT